MRVEDLIVEILTDPKVKEALAVFALDETHVNETALANAMRDVIARPYPTTVQ